MQEALLWLASGFGLGASPWAPGSFGSLVGIPLAWWLLRYSAVKRWTVAAILIVLAIPLCHWGSLWLGGGDMPPIVADEWVAMPLAVLAFPHVRRVPLLMAGYGLFRLFDILKPPPVAQVESLYGGVGIVADDVVAAIYAALVIGIALKLWRTFRR